MQALWISAWQQRSCQIVAAPTKAALDRQQPVWTTASQPRGVGSNAAVGRLRTVLQPAGKRAVMGKITPSPLYVCLLGGWLGQPHSMQTRRGPPPLFFAVWWLCVCFVQAQVLLVMRITPQAIRQPQVAAALA